MATNPAVSLPRAGAMRAALRKLELFVVQKMCSATTPSMPARSAAAGRGLGRERRHGDKFGAAHFASARVPAAAWRGAARLVDRQRGGAASGFCAGVRLRGPADVFREHAALSAFENDGQRDFDIGALASLSDPLTTRSIRSCGRRAAGEARGERRFFAAGEFFTPDRRARFVAPERPRSRSHEPSLSVAPQHRALARPVAHDDPDRGVRVCVPIRPSHYGDPSGRRKARLTDGGFAKVTTPYGSAILKSPSPGQQRGSIFAPIHWSDATAAHARIGELVWRRTTPFPASLS